MKYILANILPIVCCVLAFLLMKDGMKGWGWFVFIAIISAHTFGSSDNKDEE